MARTLLISTWDVPGTASLAESARRLGWSAYSLEEMAAPVVEGGAVYYGGIGVADAAAERFGIALVEPPFDLLQHIPEALRLRDVSYGRYDLLELFAERVFMKPADPRRKAFDAGLYRDVRDARLEEALDPTMPVLISEPVEWTEEYRCFVLDGGMEAWSPYLGFGRVVWRPFSGGSEAPPDGMAAVCERLAHLDAPALPPAFVVDVGFIRDRGWAVVEFNPAWCSGILGADPARVLPVLAAASQPVGSVDPQWVVGKSWEGEAPRPLTLARERGAVATA